MRFQPPATGNFAGSQGSSWLAIRIHNIVLPATDKRLDAISHIRWTFKLTASGDITASTDYESGPVSNLSRVVLAGATDVSLYLQRDSTALTWWLRGWNNVTGQPLTSYCGVGGSYPNQPCSLYSAATSPAYYAHSETLDNVGARVAYFNWGLGTNPPFGSRIPAQYHTGDLASYNFDANSTDATGLTTMAVSGASYSITPALAPSSVPRVSGTLPDSEWISCRAGFSCSLDGSNSSSLGDTATLTYQWVQVSGPSVLQWGGRTTATPTISGMIFGTYVVILTTTDNTGASTSVSLTFGAVATDANGVVINADPNIDKILGPMIAFGRNPWTWADSRHKYLADFFGNLLTSDYRALWREYKAGTISVTNGSAIVTGTGTNFSADLDCTSADSYFVIEYPDSDTPTGVAYKGFKVNPGTCTATSLTLNANWTFLPGTTAGLRYANFGLGGWLAWVSGSTNANYYDNVMAHYALYYRSGNTKYRDYARTLADRWFEHPFFDYGRGAGSGAITMNGSPRLLALTGLTLRALDGQPKFWNWLRGPWNFHQTYMTASGPFEDTRESAYQLQSMVLGSLFDPEPANRSSYAASLQTGITRWVTQQKGAGNWTNEYPGAGSYGVENNNTRVTGSGFNVGTCANTWLRFGTENFGYRCTYVSDGEITLNQPYQGATGSKPLQIGNLVGEGTQPFMMGLATNVLAFASTVPGITGIAATLSPALQWLSTTGFYAPAKGMYYGRGFAGCETNNGGPAGAPLTVRECKDSGDGEGAMRVFAGEALGAWSRIYPITLSPAQRSTGDDLYTANFGKWALPAGVANPDGFYNQESEDNGYTVQQRKAKDYGFFWGFGLASSWPAARLGGVLPADVRTVTMSLGLPVGVTAVSITYTAPSGESSVRSCTVAAQRASCTLPTDYRAGNYVWKPNYTSAAGSWSGDPLPLRTQ